MDLLPNKNGTPCRNQRVDTRADRLLRKPVGAFGKVGRGGTDRLDNGRYAAWITGAQSWLPVRDNAFVKPAAYLTLGTFSSQKNAQAAVSNQLGLRKSQSGAPVYCHRAATSRGRRANVFLHQQPPGQPNS